MQDEIRLRPNLTVSAGLRYEVTSPPVDAEDRANVFDPVSESLVPVGTNGVPRSGYATDYGNVAPRVGFAWTPGASADTVVRGGYGIYYNQPALAPGEGLYFNPPFFDFNLFFQLPGRLLTLNDPFPSQFPFPTPPSAVAFDRALRTAWLQQWSVGLQRQLGGRRAVEIAYVGSKGHDLLTARDINQADASPNPINLRPNPQFGDIIFQESSATSRYDALQLRVPAAHARRTLAACGLHLRQIDRRRVRFLHERGRPELSAGQQQSARRARPVELRRAPSVLGQLLLWVAVRAGPPLRLG